MAWLTKAQAYAHAEALARCIERYGVPVSIELQRGSGNSKYWGQDTFRATLAHHVVSRRSQGDTPFLSLMKNGRAGTPFLPPPIANGYMGFDGVYRILSMGLANHPGSGGPFTAGGWTIPRNQGRYYLWGTEYEGGLSDADWPADFHLQMGRANAGIIDWLPDAPNGDNLDLLLEHSHWAPGRKSDRRGYTRHGGRYWMEQAWAEHTDTATGGRTNITEEDELMAAADDILAAIGNLPGRVWSHELPDLATGGEQTKTAAEQLQITRRDAWNTHRLGKENLAAEVQSQADVEAFADTIASSLPSNLARNVAELVIHRLDERGEG